MRAPESRWSGYLLIPKVRAPSEVLNVAVYCPAASV